jgi:hypothetical protein
MKSRLFAADCLLRYSLVVVLVVVRHGSWLSVWSTEHY